MNRDYKTFVLRDGVDLYYDETLEVAIFIFLATRKRIKLKIRKEFILLVSSMDGATILHDKFISYAFSSQEIKNFYNLLDYLYEHNILIEKDWIRLLDFDDDYIKLYDRHFKYLLDLTCGGIKEIELIQKRIFTTKIAIFGLGAVGASLARELVMLGFVNFLLIDYDNVDEQDISRNLIYNNLSINNSKTEICKKMLLSVNKHANITTKELILNTDTKLDFLDDYDFIINSANTPYIGYTSIKLSRYILNTKKILFICGGFDAHLASLGELIIPGITPCSDCYTTYFSKALQDWKPMPHPKQNRTKVFGGLSSLSLFSASAAAMQILKYFIDYNQANILGGRGEFLFDNYIVDKFEVPKDENCQFCKNLKSNMNSEVQ
ncbi:ThiF family adenylyltransferase [Sulfurospirillum sp. UCH001]|uniref:ThiF family adenylyltransferase n=1 Tax=Sulfurospirillum sp. UCH001 TaxID=1581011 RepID=UPI000833CB19|nr:ThiF family adenylyltransferase [Sulfurospirillum sp. UCH001]